MNISSRCEYACRAIIALAQHPESEHILTGNAIAEQKNIPEKYLVHILLQLKHAGIVRSIRGAQGGYQLNRKPDHISLLDVVQAIDGPVLHPLPVDDNHTEELRPIWREIGLNFEKTLRNMTIRDVMDKSITTNMYYI